MSRSSEESLNRGKVIIGARRMACKVLSRLAQRPGRGNVAAVFDRSFLIETEDFFLIHVGGLPVSLTPRSILVGEDDFLRIYPILSPKQAVFMGGDGIAWFDSPLRITIGPAEIISLRTRFQWGRLHEYKGMNDLVDCLGKVEQIRGGRENISPLTGYFHTHLQFLQAPPAERIRPPDLPDTGPEGTIPYRKLLWPRIDDFLNSLKKESWEEVQRKLPEIIGLGPGLTPSGDDFLAGFLSAGAVIGGRSPEVRRLFEQLGEIILREARGRTTEVSRAMLEDAAEEEVSEPIWDFLNSVYAGDMETISEKIEKILSIGGSSGEDQLNGLAAGLLLFQRFASGDRWCHVERSPGKV